MLALKIQPMEMNSIMFLFYYQPTYQTTTVLIQLRRGRFNDFRGKNILITVNITFKLLWLLYVLYIFLYCRNSLFQASGATPPSSEMRKSHSEFDARLLSVTATSKILEKSQFK